MNAHDRGRRKVLQNIFCPRLWFLFRAVSIFIGCQCHNLFKQSTDCITLFKTSYQKNMAMLRLTAMEQLQHDKKCLLRSNQWVDYCLTAAQSGTSPLIKVAAAIFISTSSEALFYRTLHHHDSPSGHLWYERMPRVVAAPVYFLCALNDPSLFHPHPRYHFLSCFLSAVYRKHFD